MGGHGGLNILPQKKWNVYGRDNRLRVTRDEDAAAEREKKSLKEQRDREKDARYKALLNKQRGGHVVIDFEQQRQEGAEGPSETASTSIVESLEWEKCAAAARERGDPKTQTCDPRFDASFKFAMGMQEEPWWLSEATDNVCDKVEGQITGGREEKRSCLSYVKVKHTSRKSRAREKRQQKKEMYEALRRERIERESRERQKVNNMIPH